MSFTSFTPHELDQAPTHQRTADAISRIANPTTRSRVQRVAYLLGASPDMPELTREEINQHVAVQSCYDAMNANGADPNLESRESSPEIDRFVFQIPIHTTKADVPTTCVEVTFTINDSREDIFSRICAYMDIPRDYKKLGWRLNSARRSDPPRRFLTSEDVDSAFKVAAEARGSGRRKRRVVIEIVNTEPAVAKKGSKRKRDTIDSGLAPSMMPYTKELELIKEKVRCNEHRGENTWCWVDPSNGNHVPLCLNDLQFWAKSLHEDPTEMSCTLPPNGLLTDVKRTRKPRGSSSHSRATTEPATPVIHNHVHLTDFSKAPESSFALQPLSNDVPASALASRAITRQYAMYFEFDDESDEGEDGFDIKKILDQLHVKYPLVDFPKYEESLRKLGICYLVSADMFDADFYINKVKMADGAAHLFKNFVSKELGSVLHAKERRKEKGKKKARYDEDAENIPPIS